MKCRPASTAKVESCDFLSPNQVAAWTEQQKADWAWRRSIEIQFSAKQKLGFVDGSVIRSITDTTEAAQWDICNNMEEIESMNLLPTVPSPTTEVTKLLDAIDKIREESRLFQFLNGLDDAFGAQRSQLLKEICPKFNNLLMMVPLPSVEEACSAIQQEEYQRDVLKNSYIHDVEMSAMLSK
ncbi:hypothetical protein AgCh_014128 [Apium graveolens]